MRPFKASLFLLFKLISSVFFLEKGNKFIEVNDDGDDDGNDNNGFDVDSKPLEYRPKEVCCSTTNGMFLAPLMEITVKASVQMTQSANNKKKYRCILA
mmetsp:Transcript_53704/g.61076  ORF Transcript_53704/g.61076 Transcript_53704/m.61076 type:complete len:98 (-) Transcript_53704:121-414(-)